jgi:hypothetical protein
MIASHTTLRVLTVNAAVADRNSVPGVHGEIEHGGLELTGVDLIRVGTTKRRDYQFIL